MGYVIDHLLFEFFWNIDIYMNIDLYVFGDISLSQHLLREIR